MSSLRCRNLPALALCLILSAGCSKASKAKSLLGGANRDFQAQKYDQAESEYKSVLRLSQRDPVAIRQLGFIYFEEGRSRPAFQCLQEALRLDPTNTEAQLKMAEIYIGGGDSTNGLKQLELVLQADPGNQDALILLAQVSPANGLSSVRQRLEAQLRKGGTGAAACYSALGWIDLRMQNSKDAQANFQKASELDPKLVSPCLGMAEVCSLRKDGEGFAEALQKAVELSPIRSSIRLKYAEL